ncbi:ATP-binding protein [Halocynthiibacter sp. C4]|uniref:sensor histidine kinase n=1 Tax=Halocynthiibacter sp. C4 TaxID=2992758 RepID=UPI00237BFC1A|nr:ATP-binding protein [Halocynthiibacter sp. C4]MDE0589326.1 ATP-binding protein [Halocynthiibacter sp. C4]
MRQRLGAILVFILAVAGIAGGVWWFAFTAALVPLEERGRADLSLASDRLLGELQRYRQVAVLLADHPVLLSLANGGVEPRAHALLLETADKTGTLEIIFANKDGRVLASSDGSETRESDISGEAVFERAMTGALGTDHKRLKETEKRVFFFSVPVLDGGAPLGVVVVKVDIEAVEESDWRGDPQAIYFTDDTGVIFVSNRSELLFRNRNLAPVEGSERDSFLKFTSNTIGPHEIWSLSGGPYFPKRALHLTQPLPVIGMTGEVLISTAPAERSALQQMMVAVALCLVFGALLYVATERRRGLDERLKVEAEAKAELERRVEDRTRELSSLNLDLRDQIAVREEAESALKKAQADLVQAGKLSALGEMSAGISHELNQPLMAIRSFAENAEVFLDRGKTEIAAQNLSKISELSRRMGRIIKNLRAFARQEDEPITNVNINAVIDAVLEMSETRLKRDGVEVDWQRPEMEIYVRGGEVRLQQVLTNLLSNAVDAMDGYDDKRVDIRLESGSNTHILYLRDRGPGIDAPEKIFDPFYSTKKVGSAEGMGLGLSISYGLIQSFGGNIRGRNHPDGGAEFIVELAAAKEKAA